MEQYIHEQYLINQQPIIIIQNRIITIFMKRCPTEILSYFDWILARKICMILNFCCYRQVLKGYICKKDIPIHQTD